MRLFCCLKTHAIRATSLPLVSAHWFIIKTLLNDDWLQCMFSRLFNLIKSTLQKEADAAQAWRQLHGQPAHAYWMYVAPVHLTLGRDNFFMAEPAPLPLTVEEATQVVDSLNAHFADDGLHFIAKEEAWYLGLDVDPNIKTTALKHVLNQDIAQSMPKGDGALAWARLQNEIQMLLSRHPVNQARESIGQPVMNSVWCYGLGRAVDNE